MSEERLQKFISGCGVTSRRKAEELILSGKVTVNGKIVDTLGAKIDTDKDVVRINNEVLTYSSKRIYIKLNKPAGYVTTLKDQFGRKCVIDLINIDRRVYPIGRLDYDTSGLLLLTDDGELANKLMHPRYNVYKTYAATVSGIIDENKINKLKSGVMVDGRMTAKAKVKIINRINDKTNIEISIHEGRNRQVRKMFEAVKCTVLKLERTSYGKISLGSLKCGEWSYIGCEELKYLQQEHEGTDN